MKIKLALLCVATMAMVGCSKQTEESKAIDVKLISFEMKQFKNDTLVSTISSKINSDSYTLEDVLASRQVFVENPSGDNFSYYCDFNNDSYVITSMGRQRNASTIKQDGIKCEFTAKEVIEKVGGKS